MVFWTGVLLSGIGARRLEFRQNKNYSNAPEYHLIHKHKAP